MRNIRILGCSFTQGIENLERHGSNWVHYFRDLVDTKYTIYNYSQAGTGVMWHSYILNKLKKKYPDDIYICQITNPGRYAWWPEHMDINNFEMICFDREISFADGLKEYLINHEKVTFFNFGVVYNRKPEDQRLKDSDLQFARDYYDRTNTTHHWAINVNYMINNSDYSFFHLQGTKEKYLNYISSEHIIFSSEEMIGSEIFKKEIIDGGKHLSNNGNKMVAEHVYKNIKGKLK
jgi:hypothetical protein